MEICGDGHEEICYSNAVMCPMCEVTAELDGVQTKYDEATEREEVYVDELDTYYKKVNDLEDEIETLKEGNSK